MMFELVGLLLPPLIDLINRKVANTDLRFWVSVASCVVVGVALQLLEQGQGLEVYAQSILSVFGLAQLSYKGLYEKSKLQTVIRE